MAQRDQSMVSQGYTVYGAQLSFFTMKLVAGLEWHLPNQFTYRPKGALAGTQPEGSDDLPADELESRSGTHQIPVLVTPENWCVADTTPIFTLLDGRMSEPKFYPPGIVGALAAVMEEYFDEWAPRWCIHTRWQCGEETAREGARGLVAERNLPPAIARQVEETIKKWGRRAGKAIGVSSEMQQRACEAEILRVLTALNTHLLRGNRFIFGDSPTAVDCVIMGAFKAHLLRDPFPREFLKDLTAVRHWHDHVFGSAVPEKASVVDHTLSLDSLPPFCSLVLDEMGGAFAKFVEGSRDAHASESKSFVATTYGENVSYLFRPYVEKSRQLLRHKLSVHLNSCSARERLHFEQIMRHFGLATLYLPPMTEKHQPHL
eukprot:m.463910 g.463910  ORF g.463910 m.463910 type:complete len:374 (-) comp23212_c0_seq1:112-1233(-)